GMKYEFWMAGINGIRPEKKVMLRERMKTAEESYYIEETQLQKYEFLNDNDRNKIMQAQKNTSFHEEYRKMLEKGIRFLPYYDAEYPKRLREIEDYPYALYVKGSIP